MSLQENLYKNRFTRAALVAGTLSLAAAGVKFDTSKNYSNQTGISITHAENINKLPKETSAREQYCNMFDELFEKIASEKGVDYETDAQGYYENVNFTIDSKTNITLRAGLAYGDYDHLDYENPDPKMIRRFRAIIVEKIQKDPNYEEMDYYEVISGLEPHKVTVQLVKVKNNYVPHYQEVNIFSAQEMKNVIESQSYNYEALPIVIFPHNSQHSPMPGYKHRNPKIV